MVGFYSSKDYPAIWPYFVARREKKSGRRVTFLTNNFALQTRSDRSAPRTDRSPLDLGVAVDAGGDESGVQGLGDPIRCCAKLAYICQDPTPFAFDSELRAMFLQRKPMRFQRNQSLRLEV